MCKDDVRICEKCGNYLSYEKDVETFNCSDCEVTPTFKLYSKIERWFK